LLSASQLDADVRSADWHWPAAHPPGLRQGRLPSIPSAPAL